MANVNAPNGAQLASNLNPPNISVRRYVLPAGDPTATFVGDFVKSGGTSEAATGLATIAQAAAGDTIRGVVVGFEPDSTAASLSLERVHRPASTRMIALVVDDPNAIFEIQSDGTTALVDIGENADIIVGAGVVATGSSGMQLQSSDHKTTTAQLRMLGFVDRVDNTPASLYAKLLVKINEHELASTSGV